MTEPTPRLAAPHREVGGLALLLQELHAGGARLLSEVQRQWPEALTWVEDGYLRAVYGALGPVITPGPRGLAFLDLPPHAGLSAQGATTQAALRLTVLEILRRGYRIEFVSGRYLRVLDPQGKEHLLVIRVAQGPPKAATVANLIRAHRKTFQRTRGRLILVVRHPELYRYQMTRQPLLEVWGLELPGVQ